MILLDELDLEKSFKKLSSDILVSEKMLKELGQYGYMAAYLNLLVSATSHIYNCTEEVVPISDIQVNDPNDLKDVNI